MPMNVDNVKSQMRKGMLEYCVLLLLGKGEYYTTDMTYLGTCWNFPLVPLVHIHAKI